MKILLVKESRAGEQRVALVPQDVAALIDAGHEVIVEHHAGAGAGFADANYEAVGASIVIIDEASSESFAAAFRDIDIIVRAKRPNRQREALEARAFSPGTIMIGALDPLEQGSTHVAEYHRAGITAYSLDQADLPADHPMNILAAMSRLAGQLALQDALSRCQHPVRKVVIIGLGQVGYSALEAAITQDFSVYVISGSAHKIQSLANKPVQTVMLDRALSLSAQQEQVERIILDADIVMTSARQAGQRAPQLISAAMLAQMKPGAVVVDMAISEGGNVAGSEHDKTLKTAKGVLITNTSGYPKVMPQAASVLWSTASLQFIAQLIKDSAALPVKGILAPL